jgi:hypothetical protein
MTAALALASTIIAALPTIEGDISGLISWIGSVRSAAKQSAQWTPELETDFLEALLASAKTKAWQPDAALKAQG